MKSTFIRLNHNFPFERQLDSTDCGVACLAMIAKHYGRFVARNDLRQSCSVSREGMSLTDLCTLAELIGFRGMAVKIDLATLQQEAPLPCIIHWRQNHFVVLFAIDKRHAHIADPAFGLIRMSHQELLSNWLAGVSIGDQKGTCLLIETTPGFFTVGSEDHKKNRNYQLASYLRPYLKLFAQLVLGLLVGTGLQLLLPILTQSIVDRGINNLDIGFVYLVLVGQLVLLISQSSVDFIRGWILMYLNTKISVSMLSDFLVKLFRLPIHFFESRTIGDILTRIGDQKRVQQFLTGSLMNVFFTFANFTVFGIVLCFYNPTIFAVYMVGTILYAAWICLFLRARKDLDYLRFEQSSRSQSMLLQLILGMQDILLTNSDQKKRWEWERIQSRLFHVNVRGLRLEQFQRAGVILINQSTSLTITAIAANEVIDGYLTFGMMLSIQYIIGQLRSPIELMLELVKSYQDARISLERLDETHLLNRTDQDQGIEEHPPEQASIRFVNLAFKYGENQGNFVLKDIDFEIQSGKTTAVVGPSGSGKSTLVKLLLGFYEPTEGSIKIGNTNLRTLNKREWRKKCGVVMQDGYIFSDTAANNIALGQESVDYDRLHLASDMANTSEYVNSLARGYSTMLGAGGRALSQGQKQRLLLARAVYRDPEYLILDEATNSLDASNERTIMNSLRKFTQGKTVLVIAHRLSTVANADNIVVLDNGRIIESGRHEELVRIRGLYYELIRNQLELGA